MPKKKASTAKRGPGRPRIEFDLKTVEQLAAMQCTEQEIAAVLGVSPETIRKRKHDDAEFLGAVEKGRAAGRASLRRLQWTTARDPKSSKSATMQIWLGKQWLGQSDRNVISLARFEDLLFRMGEAVSRHVQDREALEKIQEDWAAIDS